MNGSALRQSCVNHPRRMFIYDEYERERQRKIRNEYRIILELLKELKFDYVVKEHVPARISFNSSRDRFPRSPAQPKVSFGKLESFAFGGKLKDSKNLSSVFASTVPRFAENAQPTFRTFQYPGEKREIFRNLSFSRSPAKRGDFLLDKRVGTPGPGTYPSDSLFSRKSSVVVICGPRPSYMCFLCGTKIPEGCFWRNLRRNRNLCRACMTQEVRLRKPHRVMLRYKKVRELERFQRVKNCSFYHKHEGTRASVQFLPPRDVRKRMQREKYLNRFRNFSRIQ